MEISECRVYVPAKDFALSQRFYEALGFTLTPGWGGTMDCRHGAMLFRLQDYYVADWANNFMFSIAVDDATEVYTRASQLAQSGDFPPMRVKEPEDVDGSLVTHVVDPSGVLLVFVQRR